MESKRQQEQRFEIKSNSFITIQDLNTLNSIDSINNWNTFKSKYQNLFNSIRAKCLGRPADQELINKLNNLQSRITDSGNEQDDFSAKIKTLKYMAEGNIRNVNNAPTAA